MTLLTCIRNAKAAVLAAIEEADTENLGDVDDELQEALSHLRTAEAYAISDEEELSHD